MKKHLFPKMLFSFFCGFLAALPLLFDEIPYLSFVLFIPFLAFLFLSDEGMRLRAYYLFGLCFFFGYYASAFSFFTAMYPLDFAGLGELASLAVLFAAMVLLPLLQAWFSAFAILLFGLFKQKGLLRFPLAASLVIAALFTLFSYAQNFTWAGVPWANPAVGIASSPLIIQSASLFGSGFLCFFILFINAAVTEGYLAFRLCRDKSFVIAFLCAVLLFTSVTVFGAARLAREANTEDSFTVAVIQGSYPSTKNTYISAHLRACRYEARMAAKEADVDLMLWSESVLTYALQADESARDFFSAIAVETGAIQVIGSFSSEPTPEGEEGYYNALFLFFPDGTMGEETYQKRRPVPFGEYVPMASLFKLLIPALTEISMLSRDTIPGEGASLLHTQYGALGGLICFDSIYPALARESVKAGASILLLSTDDSWFDGSFGKSLHFRHAILRAVENGRTIVRTGNTGQSGVIDPHGNITLTIAPDQPGHGIATVSPSEELTVYTVIGEAFTYSSLLFLLAIPLFGRKKNKKFGKDPSDGT